MELESASASATTAKRPLLGQVALVTGASRTLGRVVALEMVRRGADCAVNYHRSKTAAEELVSTIRSMEVRSEAVGGNRATSDGPSRVALATTSAIGGVDILIHNAGPYDDRPFMELPESEWRRIFDANCTALFLLASELAPAMKRAGRGRIVAIGATSALMRSHSIYGLGKAGLIHLVEALAIELAPEITVNAVSPGLIADNEDMTAEFSDDAIADTPLRRLVTRGEIANVVAAICGPPFDVVTGQNIVMDGGRVLPRRG